MKIAIINMTHKGSTGKIMLNVAETARKSGYIARTYSPMLFNRIKKQSPLVAENHFTWGTLFEGAFHYYGGTLLGLNGFFSYRGTKKLIEELKTFQPDIVHLNNLHNFTINLPLLFKYLKKSKVKVIWTLHDCWSFTGHCPHFTVAKCDKWKSGCHNCSQLKLYPKSMIDTSRIMYQLKKKWFTAVDNMTIVTPSQWLADLVKQSYLRKYPVAVINNGIDLNVFKPVKSDFRVKNKISEGKKVLLGVSMGWSHSKGIDVFVELAKRLDKEQYQIVLVGTDERIAKLLPKNIIAVNQTGSQQELAEIYSSADLFINPTREETYPTVNMESLACGTPVITFKTGGSPEIIDKTCGSVVEYDDIDAMEKGIIRICEERSYSSENCLIRAQSFDMNDRFKEYVKLYENCTHSTERTI